MTPEWLQLERTTASVMLAVVAKASSTAGAIGSSCPAPFERVAGDAICGQSPAAIDE